MVQSSDDRSMWRFPALLTVLLGVLPICSDAVADEADAPKKLSLAALHKRTLPSVVQVMTDRGSGTGFFVSSDGAVLTNCHVVAGAKRIEIALHDGKKVKCEGVLALDQDHDLALLSTAGKGYPALKLKGSPQPPPGTPIAVIGNPKGLRGSVTEGIVSANRTLGGVRVVQITAAISPGSSGSPVIDMQGAVVGIAVYSLRGGQSLNFAVPASFGATLDTEGDLKPISVVADLAPSSRFFGSKVATAMIAAERAKDFGKMMKLGLKATRAYEDDANAWWGLGLAYAHLKFTAEAVSAFKKAVALDSEHVAAWHALGLELMLAKKPRQALAVMKQVTRLEPRERKYWSLMAVLQIDLDDLDGALASTKKAISRGGTAGDFLRLARLQYSRKAYDDVVVALREVRRLDPDDADVWLMFSQVHLARGRHDWAVRAYKGYLKMKPKDADVWSRLGQSYLELKRRPEAQAAFARAATLDPSNSLAWMALVKLHLRRGDYPRAYGAVRRLYKVDYDAAVVAHDLVDSRAPRIIRRLYGIR